MLLSIVQPWHPDPVLAVSKMTGWVQALRDGVEQMEWEGLTLSFESDTDAANWSATMVDTPIDFIWPVRGSWSVNAADELILDEVPAEEFCAGPGELVICRWITWPVRSISPDRGDKTTVTGLLAIQVRKGNKAIQTNTIIPVAEMLSVWYPFEADQRNCCQRDKSQDQ